MSDTAFSIDIQERFTRISDSKVAGDKIETLSLGAKETVPFFYSTDNEQTTQKQAEVIAQLYSTLKIRKKIVNVVVPDGFTYSQIVSMPQLKEKELLSAIRYQADEFIPMPIEETNLDIEILNEDAATKKVLVLIVAAPKKLVSQIEKTVELAGLIPGALENELTAAGRIYSDFLGKNKRNAAMVVVNFGYTSTSIYLVNCQTSFIVFARTVKIGMELFMRDIKVNLNVDDKKSEEILKTIGFSKNGSFDLEVILGPVFKELITEIQKFIAIAKERHSLQVDSIQTFNYDTKVALFSKKLEEQLKLPAVVTPIASILVPNPVSQSFSADISSYISAISASL